MHILVLSNYTSATSSSGYLAAQARNAGHTVAMVSTLSAARQQARLWGRVDVFVPRLSRRLYETALETTEYFTAQGVLTSISPEGIRCSHNKYLAYQKFAAAALPTPHTRLVTVESQLADEVDFPAIIKPLDENQGNGVKVVRDAAEYRAKGRELLSTYGMFITQEFIAESVGCDTRVFVVGDRVVASMERRGQPGVITSNLATGGSAVAVTATPEQAKIAIAACQQFQAVYAGIDIIESARGPLVLEVNSSPGFKIEQVTGVNVASAVVKELEIMWRQKNA